MEIVVPANAGTHRPLALPHTVRRRRPIQLSMDPGVRRDDVHYF
jgi:hypothetical protein